MKWGDYGSEAELGHPLVQFAFFLPVTNKELIF